jgi:hypothetical protein
MRPTSRTTIPVQMRPLHEGRSEDKYLVEHAIQEELKLERHIKEVRAEHSSSHTSVIVMRELLVAALLIVAIAPLTPGLVLQYEETVVIQKTNLTLQSGESYWTTFTLEPYAPHTTESDYKTQQLVLHANKPVVHTEHNQHGLHPRDQRKLHHHSDRGATH